MKEWIVKSRDNEFQVVTRAETAEAAIKRAFVGLVSTGLFRNVKIHDLEAEEKNDAS